MKKKICHLCGKQIENKRDCSAEHIPARQFFPKSIREQEKLNLLTIPSHKECNESYSKDEEYFYTALYPIVHAGNALFSNIVYNDLKRKTRHEPQKKLVRQLLQNFSSITKGGIQLPKGKYEYSIDEYRVQRVVLKIVQGLFFHHNQAFLLLEKIKHFDMHLDDNDVLEVFKLSWQGSGLTFCCKQVFSYKYFSYDRCHLWTLLFWDAVMFTVMAESKRKISLSSLCPLWQK